MTRVAVPISDSNRSREPSERSESSVLEVGGRTIEKDEGRKAYSRLARFRSAASICWTDKAECRPGRDNTVFGADGEGMATFRVAGLFSTQSRSLWMRASFQSRKLCCGRKIIFKLLACNTIHAYTIHYLQLHTS